MIEFASLPDEALQYLYENLTKVAESSREEVLKEVRKREFDENSKFNVLTDSNILRVMDIVKFIDVAVMNNEKLFENLRLSNRIATLVEESLKERYSIEGKQRFIEYCKWLDGLNWTHINNNTQAVMIKYARREAFARLRAMVEEGHIQPDVLSSFSMEEYEPQRQIENMPTSFSQLTANKYAQLLDTYEFRNKSERKKILTHGIKYHESLVTSQYPYECLKIVTENQTLEINIFGLVVKALHQRPNHIEDIDKFLDELGEWFFSNDEKEVTDGAWTGFLDELCKRVPEVKRKIYYKIFEKEFERFLAGIRSSKLSELVSDKSKSKKYSYDRKPDVRYRKYSGSRSYLYVYDLESSHKDNVSAFTEMVDMYGRLQEIVAFDKNFNISIKEDIGAVLVDKNKFIANAQQFIYFMTNLELDGVLQSLCKYGYGMEYENLKLFISTIYSLKLKDGKLSDDHIADIYRNYGQAFEDTSFIESTFKQMLCKFDFSGDDFYLYSKVVHGRWNNNRWNQKTEYYEKIKKERASYKDALKLFGNSGSMDVIVGYLLKEKGN